MNKICTDISQSRKLIELGIDVNTADMMWEYNPDKEVYWDKPTIIPIDSYIFINDIPAWSLAALLDILAKETHNRDEDGHIVLSSYKGNWWNISPINCISEEIKESNNQLDACYEMVCWLLEN